MRAGRGPGTGDQGTLWVKVVYLDKKGVPEGIAYAEEATYEGEGWEQERHVAVEPACATTCYPAARKALRKQESDAAIEPLHLDELCSTWA